MKKAQNDRLLSVRDVTPIVGFSRAEIYKMAQGIRQNRTFPRPIKIGRRSFWKQSDIQNWIAELNAAPATTPNS